MTISKALLDELLSGVERPEDLLGDKGLMKELKVRLMERMLGAELTEHLGYEPHGAPASQQSNRSNGAPGKVLKGNDGAVPTDIPRPPGGGFVIRVVAPAPMRTGGPVARWCDLLGGLALVRVIPYRGAMNANPKQKPAGRLHRGVAAVDRALAILGALESATTPRTLAELSRATGLYKSTILRLIESLSDAGYVMRVEDAKYSLGPVVMRLGIAYEAANPLRHTVLPVLRNLVDIGTESPSFHVRKSPNERLCLFRLDSNHSTLDRVQAGDRLTIRRGAAGKVLLAFEGTEGSEMDQIRATCFATSLGERDPICAGVAAPVFAARGRILGALSLSGPRERFADGDITRMRGQLIDAARELSHELGGDYPI